MLIADFADGIYPTQRKHSLELKVAKFTPAKIREKNTLINSNLFSQLCVI